MRAVFVFLYHGSAETPPIGSATRFAQVVNGWRAPCAEVWETLGVDHLTRNAQLDNRFAFLGALVGGDVHQLRQARRVGRNEDSVPRFRFNWANLPPSLLKALSRDLPGGYDDGEGPAAALQAKHGAKPKEEFIREAWPTLLESWLRVTKDSREWVVEALRETRRETGSAKGRDAQMEYLRGLRNSKN